MDDKNIFYGPKISLPSTNNSDGTLTKDEVMSKGPRYLEISDEDMEELWNVLDADGDGAMSGDEAHGQLQAMHADADTDGDGVLTLEEFEVLHGEMIRAMMVDRFQHLDTDGDGMVTTGEMTAPADRMNMRPSAEQMMGDEMGTQDN